MNISRVLSLVNHCSSCPPCRRRTTHRHLPTRAPSSNLTTAAAPHLAPHSTFRMRALAVVVVRPHLSSLLPSAHFLRRTSRHCRPSMRSRLCLCLLTLPPLPATHSPLTIGSPTYVASAATVAQSTHSLSHDPAHIRLPYRACPARPSPAPPPASTHSPTATSQPSTSATSPHSSPQQPSTRPLPPQLGARCHPVVRGCVILVI